MTTIITEQIGSGNVQWQWIASSADGSHLAAVAYNGYLYTSTDFGVTWTQQTAAGNRNWYSITSSADGTHLAACAYNNEYIYTSTDSGVTWTQQTAAGVRNWISITSSADGSHLAAAVAGGGIFTSTDFGVTWTQATSAGSRGWYSITSSADGTHLAACAYDNDYIYTSGDSGVTWTQQTAATARNWQTITSSADGSHLAAGIYGGGIFTSTDFGVTWTQATSTGSRGWTSITSSADGSHLAACSDTGYIYTSTDFGVTWTQQTISGSLGWTSIASSADGSHLAAVAFPSNVWTLVVTPGNTVTFDANGGTGVAAPQDSMTPNGLSPNTATRAGYSFNGWNTVADGSGTHYNDNDFYDFSASMTLYAQWKLPQVTFLASSGTSIAAPQSSSVPANLTTNTATNSGKTFTGWNTMFDGSGTHYADGALYDFVSDLYLVAQWSPSTVTFDANGGTGSVTPQTSSVPTNLTPNTATYAGKTFTGWNINPFGYGADNYNDQANYDFGNDVTLYAQWSPSTVTFDPNGGNGEAAPQTSSVPTNLTPNTATYAGKTFTGQWYNRNDNRQANFGIGDGGSYNFTTDITLYAQWAVNTITFYGNGGTGEATPQIGSQDLNITTNTATRTGFAFAGWNTNANGSGIAYTDGEQLNLGNDLYLHAQWTPVSSGKTVTYVPNGSPETDMVPQTSSVPTNLNTFSYAFPNHSYLHWNTNADGSGISYDDLAIYDFSADITLYAQWQLGNPVFFGGNGATSGSTPYQVASTPTALEVNGFVKIGSTFTGWNTNADGSGISYANEATYDFSAPLDLYAQWTVISVEKPVTIAGALKAVLAIALPDLHVYRLEAPSLTETPVVVIYDGLSVSSRTDIISDLILTETAQVDLYTQTGSDFSLPDAVHKALHRCELALATGQAFLCLVQQRTANPAPGTPNDESITRTTYTLTITRKP